MKADNKTIANAAAMVRRSRRLMADLREWFSRKGDCPDPGIADFDEWVLRYLETQKKGGR